MCCTLGAHYYRAQPLWSFNAHCMHAACSFALHGIMYRFWNESLVTLWFCYFFALLDLAIPNATQQALGPFAHLLIKSFRRARAGHCFASAHKAISMSFFSSSTASYIFHSNKLCDVRMLRSPDYKWGKKWRKLRSPLYSRQHFTVIAIATATATATATVSLVQIIKWFFYLFRAIFYDDYCYDWWY